MAEEKDKVTYEDRLQGLCIIAKPLADKKLTKRLYKVTKKASKENHAKRGVKEVTKAIRKGEQGIVILAGDVTPIDVISHLPVMCEEAHVPYIYVPSKEDLGVASLSDAPSTVIMVTPVTKEKKGFENEDLKELFETVEQEMKQINEL